CWRRRIKGAPGFSLFCGKGVKWIGIRLLCGNARVGESLDEMTCSADGYAAKEGMDARWRLR
ncbi:MAG: hypothetical protein ACTTH3_08790, partial [Schwartzia sp. (in: firmicutes)]